MRTLKERFDDKWITIPETDCWWWIGHDNGNGYGRIKFNGIRKRAHRVSYELHTGPIPDGMCVCHACDNSMCVNPEHLWLGTTADNMADRDAKGRTHRPIGEINNNSKLTDDQVAEIREMRAGGMLLKEIAKGFPCSFQHVSRIVNGNQR